MADRSMLERYEERVVSISNVPPSAIANLPQDFNDDLKNGIKSLEWSKGSAQATVTAVPNVEAIQQLSHCDIRILLAPLDLPNHINTYPGFKMLVSVFNVPDQFLAERLHNVPYSFGSQLRENGVQNMWMHFLVKGIPASQNGNEEEERAWFRMAFYLQWNQSNSQRRNITLVCFGALKTLKHEFTQMRGAQKWETIMENPYILVTFILESWYDRVDRIVWRANDRGSELETKTVEETTSLDSLTLRDKLDKLKNLYRLLQTVLWLREGLDASLRATALVIEHYQESDLPAVKTMKGRNVLKEFAYRQEMFRATQLRLNSLHDRLETINHISYGLASLRDNHAMTQNSQATLSINDTMKTDSHFMRRDSSRMALIAWIGIILLPTSLVATVISAVSDTGENASKMPTKMGILFAVSVPMTIVLAVWFKTYLEPRSRRI
ncbi:hypothetical protein BKA61DRAFT_98594 [Leptodontidium sp. MPI-SDFR-AT-0119]|nr:hypothetical protein BKA61DRAFT_98594 [Leptodontidium sp. MPI-SDFR-AT-0119]